MKKISTHKLYKGNTGGYNPRKNDAVINGELFSFGIQIKRKNGKIYIRETSNAKTIFSMISDSVRDDTPMNISLLKSHLISQVLQELEKGFDRLKNPIGGCKSASSNDTTFKPKDTVKKVNLLENMNEQADDSYKRFKEINDNLEGEMEKSAERMRKLDERRKQLEDFLNKMGEDGEKREKDYKNFMENSKKTLEDCNKAKDILEQLSDMFLSGGNPSKKEALIKELEKLGIEGVKVLRSNDFADRIDKSITKKDIH